MATLLVIVLQKYPINAHAEYLSNSVCHVTSKQMLDSILVCHTVSRI